MQDVVVGHRQFDERFVVKASDEDLARAWLEPGVMQPLSKLVSWSHHLEGGRLASTRDGIVEGVDELVRIVRTAARLAGRGSVLLAEWDGVAQALGGVLRGALWRDPEAAITVGSPASPTLIELVRVDLPNGNPRLVTRVRAQRGGGSGERFVAAPHDQLTEAHGEVVPAENAGGLELRSSDPGSTATRFDGERRQALDALRPLAVVGTETEVAILFAGVMFDTERLRAATVIAHQLAAATEPVGPYR
jgi:hypothetical protein